MVVVIQKINRATIIADGEDRGSIGKGLYLLVGIEEHDTERDCDLLVEKIVKLRIFEDDNGKMNLSVLDVNGDVGIVSNFTLNANYVHGNRPDYLRAAKPPVAEPLYEFFVEKMKSKIPHVISGMFGSDMQTDMTTSGPVTIVMNSGELGGYSYYSNR